MYNRLNWKLASHRTRRAYVRTYTDDLKRYTRIMGYDTAARIADTNEAFVLGVGLLAYHEAARDGKRVSDKEWEGLKCQ